MAYEDEIEETPTSRFDYNDGFGERLGDDDIADDDTTSSAIDSNQEELIPDESDDDMATEPGFRESLSSDDTLSSGADSADTDAPMSSETDEHHQGFGEKIREKFNDLTHDDSDRSV